MKSIKKSLFNFYKAQNGAYNYKHFELNNPGNFKSRNCFYYYKCIFIHIPKTAGKSISQTLFGNFAGGHTQVGGYLNIFGASTFNKYYKFAFVRNPWDRIFSAFNHYVNGASKFPTDNNWEVEYLFYQDHLSHLKSFEEFVMDWLNEERVLNSAIHFIPQHLMITLPENRDNILVDFLGRFENIDEDYKKICNKLNIPEKELEHINISNTNNQPFFQMYTKEMIDKIAVLYAKDIELFQYSFPAII